jgi:predicted  nucleic acid-binding Zn-ribbon protein
MYKYLIIILFFSSCFSEKKAERKLNKVYSYYPEVVAKKSSKLFPCINQTISIDTTDSVYRQIEIQIQKTTDTLKSIISQIDTIKDESKIKFYKAKLIESYQFIEGLQQTLQRQVPYIEKTIKVTDTALQTEFDQINKECNDYRLRYEKLLKALIWLLVALSVSILINVIKLK